MLNWMRGGGAWRRWARDVGNTGDKAAQLASWEPADQQKAASEEESILTQAATDLTRQWSRLKGEFQSLRTEDPSDKDLNELRQEALERRIITLGASSFARGRNVDRGTYQPVYDIFQEMVEVQEHLWDSVLQACEKNGEDDWTLTISSLELCESLGEQALVRLPSLSRQRRRELKTKERRAVLGCLGLLVVIVLVVIAIALWG